MTKAINLKKRRAQRGRPRDDGVMREPNGRACRAQEPVMAVVVNARIRHGVSPEEAPRQEGGSALGRLWGQKLITTAQRDAGEAYAELCARADSYVPGRPHGFERVDGRAATDWDLMTRHDREEYAQRATAALGKRTGLEYALDAVEARATVYWVCVMDCDPQPWMLPTLRDGLALLARNFRVGT